LVAGVTHEIDLEDALGIASFMVAAGRVPGPGRWVDGIVEQQQVEAIENFAASVF